MPLNQNPEQMPESVSLNKIANILAHYDVEKEQRDDIIKAIEHEFGQLISASTVNQLRSERDAAEKNCDSANTKLVRYVEENDSLHATIKAQAKELNNISAALGTSEGHSSVDHVLILRTRVEHLEREIKRLNEIIDKCL